MQSVRPEPVDMVRQPPQAIESEQTVLGALLMDPRAWDRVDWLQPAAFFRLGHRIIFEAIRDIAGAGRGLDVIILQERLKAAGKLEDAGGAQYLGELLLNTPSIATIRRHAELVQEASIRRQIAAHASEIADRAYIGAESGAELAAAAEDRFLSVLDARHGGGEPEPLPIGEALDWLDSPTQGISTGYPNIDRLWGGLRPGELIIVAGRPSMGKSGLVMNIAEHVSETTPVLAFSLEMTSRSVTARAIKYHRHLVGTSDAVTHMQRLKFWIDQTPAIGVPYVRARAKRLKRTHGLGLIVVDYLQLMTAPGENRTQEVSAISRGLKAIAKEFDVPVLAVSQLSRGLEGRNDHRPMISDLRESGQIEQDADIIAMVYREEYYQPETPLKGVAEILTRKHREGATGVSYLNFEAEYARFKNLEGPLPHQPAPEPKPRRYTAGRKAAGAPDNVFDMKSRQAGDDK